MAPFLSIEGTVVSIDPFMVSNTDRSYCTLMIGVQSKKHTLVYFTIDVNTYFVHHITLKKRDSIIAFYDAGAPAPLIYPPRYRAVVIAKKSPQYFVKVDSFNKSLISSDHKLQLNVSPKTKVLLPNNQVFLGNIVNKDLVVVYSFTTKSIPAITSPSQIIVLCNAPF